MYKPKCIYLCSSELFSGGRGVVVGGRMSRPWRKQFESFQFANTWSQFSEKFHQGHTCTRNNWAGSVAYLAHGTVLLMSFVGLKVVECKISTWFWKVWTRVSGWAGQIAAERGLVPGWAPLSTCCKWARQWRYRSGKPTERCSALLAAPSAVNESGQLPQARGHFGH